MQNTEKRKLRDDLTQEQREKAERIGSFEFKSNRKRYRSHGDVAKFIPSREQH